MRKLILSIALMVSGLLFQSASAQLRVHLNVNIGSQPIWGPVGYDHVEYYYMPDIDAYYYVPTRQYIFREHGRWIFSATLPGRFNFDLYNGYKVVINEPKPYLHNDIYRNKYAHFKGRHDQQIIRNSDDSRYFEIKDHPKHEQWNRDHDHNNNHNNDHDNRHINERDNNHNDDHNNKHKNNHDDHHHD